MKKSAQVSTTKQAFYRATFGRSNFIKKFVLDLFMAGSSWPRMLLEVFLRTNQGERFFSFSGCMTVAVILAVWPVFASIGGTQYDGGATIALTFVGRYTSWYAFLAAFVYMSFARRSEVKRLPSVFDFARFSYSSGNIHPKFFERSIKGQPADVRTIETMLEPGLFFAIGFTLFIAAQPIGLVLMVSSIFYSLSNISAYHTGDNLLMDLVDSQIVGQQVANMFSDKPSSNTQGFRFMGRVPTDPETKRKLSDMLDDDEAGLAF